MNDYDRLKELAEAAGPGPWVTVPGVTDDYRAVIAQWHEDEEWITDDGVATFYAEYIAAAHPDAILNLLEDLRLTRAELVAEKHKVLAYRKAFAESILVISKQDEEIAELRQGQGRASC